MTTNEIPDIAAVMAEIRQRVRSDVAANRDTQKPFQGTAADFHATRKAGEILHSEELRYLNTNYAYGPRLNLDAITSHRPGLIGKVIVKCKRKLLSMIWDLLKDYFTAERDFQANLVRLLNDFTKYVDARDAANFWELIRKLDYDIAKVSDRVERIGDEQVASLRSSERDLCDAFNAQLGEQQQKLERLTGGYSAKIATLENVTSGIESILARCGKKQPAIITPPESEEGTERTDLSYLLLENRSRGSEDEISERLKIYPPLFSKATSEVLDIGSGRGELLDLFKQNNIPAYGVDLDPAMVETCAAKGHKVFCGDAIKHLRALKDASLSGVIAIQVVEHLTREQLEELFTLCAKKVQKGGKVVFETINPCSLVALSSNFYRDLTHVWPLHPDTLSYAMQMSGLKNAEIRYLSPVPEEAQLHHIPVESYMTPHFAHTVNLFNDNISRINALLFGHQDYCVIAEA
ncbi:MAG: methyltransferase domain-containing protein [Bdellovibrionota bacterium]|jgi:2-polyprenyl-3-methyl-5-hydroxy-6-metoxy-1,4-benzoquinol methylase